MRRAKIMVSPVPWPAQGATAVVVASGPTGITVELAGDQFAGQRCSAQLATHLYGVCVGQQVWVAGEAESCLITAAWPHPDAPQPLRWDAASGNLTIHATGLALDAVASVELRCGNARIHLDLAGQVEIAGDNILSSALGTQRIEGASIDLN